jgi:hypothetical protein
MSRTAYDSNFMIVKKPGDGSISGLKEILKEVPGETVALEFYDVDNPTLIERFEQLGKIQGTPVNLVFDLTGVTNLGKWAEPLSRIMESHVVAGHELPRGSILVNVIRHEAEQKSPLGFSELLERTHGCVASKTNLESFRILGRAIKRLRTDSEITPLREGPNGSQHSM